MSLIPTTTTISNNDISGWSEIRSRSLNTMQQNNPSDAHLNIIQWEKKQETKMNSNTTSNDACLSIVHSLMCHRLVSLVCNYDLFF